MILLAKWTYFSHFTGQHLQSLCTSGLFSYLPTYTMHVSESKCTPFARRLQELGLEICEIPCDGNCMFASLSHQLNFCGIEKSPSEVRRDIVNVIATNPTLVWQACFLKLVLLCNSRFVCLIIVHNMVLSVYRVF